MKMHLDNNTDKIETLYQATRHLHHACEEHTIGQAMINCTISPQEWADWLYALKIIHDRIDPELPVYAQVSGELTMDLLELLPIIPNRSIAAENFAQSLTSTAEIGGAAYVLVGAHRRGGQITKRKFKEAGLDLPTNHVNFTDPENAERLVKSLRPRLELSEHAIKTFETLLKVMDEILSRRIEQSNSEINN